MPEKKKYEYIRKTEVYEGKQYVGWGKTETEAYKKLAAKIEAGYDCDIFICEDEACMDWLDATKDKEVNPNGNDCLAEGTRSAVFKGTPEGAEEEMTFSAAVIKTTAQEKEAGKFMSFIESENADKVYDASGFERVTE